MVLGLWSSKQGGRFLEQIDTDCKGLIWVFVIDTKLAKHVLVFCETFRSLHSQTLLILGESKYKNELVHEEKSV